MTPMASMLTPDSIWIAPGTSLPEVWVGKSSPGPNGWSRLGGERKSSDSATQLRGLGWTFFFIATPIVSTVYGFRRSTLLEDAAAKLMAAVRFRRCNCLQIDHIETRSFWGIPYVSITAHPRHIQKGFVFAGQ